MTEKENKLIHYKDIEGKVSMMTNFKGNYVTRDDVRIAKNYLTWNFSD